jgi:hypothetical protein
MRGDGVEGQDRGLGRFGDRLFVAGCTLAYAVLIGSVLAALKMYAA